MAQETRIDPEHLAEFLPVLADDVLDGLAACMGKGWDKMVKGKPSDEFGASELADVWEARDQVLMALQMGLLLAKRQKELPDTALSIFRSRGVSADEVWQSVMEVYHEYPMAPRKGNSERDRIDPDYFTRFLLYFADGQLKEMSKYMDNEWKKGWNKRQNPLRLKPGERVKVVTVGNRAVLPIIIGLLMGNRQPELLEVDWPKGRSLDLVWGRILHAYRSFLYYKRFVDGKPS